MEGVGEEGESERDNWMGVVRWRRERKKGKGIFLVKRGPPRSTQSRSSAASDVYKRQLLRQRRGRRR